MAMRQLTYAFICFCLLAGSAIQAEQIEFVLSGNGGNGLLPGNVTPGTSSNGSGDIGLTGIIFDTGTNVLHIDVEWGSDNGYSDLTGEVTMLHLHGPTDDLPPVGFSQTGPLIVDLALSLSFDSSATGGGVNGDYFINPSDVQGLLEGRTYINVHTAMYEFGEIRGYLVQAIPEPGSAMLLGGLGVTLLMRRRR